jgi:hypothetical protein
MTASEDKSASKVDDIPKDCMQCKITGVVFLSGLSLYWNHMRLQTPKSAVSHRVFLGTTSLGKSAARTGHHCTVSDTLSSWFVYDRLPGTCCMAGHLLRGKTLVLLGRFKTMVWRNVSIVNG